MDKLHIVICFLLGSIVVHAQSDTVSLGSNTSLYIGENTRFYFGGNTGFGGALENNGTIISYSNLNFLANESVGKMGFTGDREQTIYGGEIILDSLGVDKTGKLIIKTDRVLVSGSLNVTNGAIQTDAIDDLIVTGETNNEGQGYILGTLVGLTSNQDVTFPMGIEVDGNGFPNYLTLSNTDPGVTVIVDCIPDPDSLFLSEDMIGIAEQMEWDVRTLSSRTSATISVNFSGLDLVNFTNGNEINATTYEPALVVLQSGDTLFQILESNEATVTNERGATTSGSIVGSTSITIDTLRTRIAVAWIPVVDGPEFYVPNAFSPAGFYEENRTFRPFFAGGEVTSISMRVFSAYNEEIYTYSANGTNLDLSLIGWDGNLRSGQVAEEGVYYYTIQLIADAQAYEQTGSVLLVK